MIARLLCWLRGVHRDPVRQALGGFRCSSCGSALADYEDAGLQESGYVLPVRKVFNRDRHELTRTSAFEPTPRRGW